MISKSDRQGMDSIQIKPRNESSGDFFKENIPTVYEKMELMNIPLLVSYLKDTPDERLFGPTVIVTNEMIESVAVLLKTVMDIDTLCLKTIVNVWIKTRAICHEIPDEKIQQIYGGKIENTMNDVFSLLGPVHGDEECRGRCLLTGHRMMICTCYEEDEEDWFTSSCDICSVPIRYRNNCIRIPLDSGGWFGCFCSLHCLKMKKNDTTYLLALLFSKQIEEIGLITTI